MRLIGELKVRFKLNFRDTAFAAEMAREILWEKEDDLKLEDFVDVSQT
jgi:hypothetical protein